MGNIMESITRPGNTEREQQVKELVADITSDLKFIRNSANDIITTMNGLLDAKFQQVVFDEYNPRQLLEDIRDRFNKIERASRKRYEEIEETIDKPPLDEVIAKWKGRSAAETGDMVNHFKDLGFAGEAAAIAVGLAIFVVFVPTLTAMFGPLGTLGAVALSVLGGLTVMAVIGAIAAEERCHKLEQAKKELTETSELLKENRDKIANSAEELKLAVRIAKVDVK